MKRSAIALVLLAITLSGCKTGSVLPAVQPQASQPATPPSAGGIIMSHGALIEQEHHDRIQRIRRLADKHDIPPPSIDQQLFLPKELFGTDRDIPVIRIAWSDRAFFDTDRDIPRTDSESVLAMLAESMRNDLPDTHLLVVGHTDARGPESYNEDLSLRRAENVADRLMALGINSYQVTYMGMGEIQPIASNMTTSGMARNRRVEFFLGAYSEVTTEAVSRVPFNPEHRRLPQVEQKQRTPSVANEERSVSVYSGQRKPVAAGAQRTAEAAGSERQAHAASQERQPETRQVAREVTIGGRERTIDMPAIVYREPAIGSRTSGF